MDREQIVPKLKCLDHSRCNATNEDFAAMYAKLMQCKSGRFVWLDALDFLFQCLGFGVKLRLRSAGIILHGKDLATTVSGESQRFLHDAFSDGRAISSTALAAVFKKDASGEPVSVRALNTDSGIFLRGMVSASVSMANKASNMLISRHPSQRPAGSSDRPQMQGRPMGGLHWCSSAT
jgi:hypothetical protein